MSVFVTSISFAIYLVCRLIGWWRSRGVQRDEAAVARRSTGPIDHVAPGAVGTDPAVPGGSATPAHHTGD